MTLLAAQTVKITGTTPTYSAVTSSDTVKYRGENQFLIVKNGSGGSVNVTVVVPGSKYGQANPDVVVAVPASGERWIGPFHNDMADADNIITINYSATTTITHALVQV